MPFTIERAHRESSGIVFQKLFLNEYCSDVTVRCQDEDFPCHALIICAYSTLFAAEVDRQKELAAPTCSVFADVPCQLMHVALRYMYFGFLNIHKLPDTPLVEALPSLYALADRLDISGLREDVISRFEKLMKESSEPQHLVLSALRSLYISNWTKDSGLRSSLVRLITTNAVKLKMSDEDSLALLHDYPRFAEDLRPQRSVVIDGDDDFFTAFHKGQVLLMAEPIKLEPLKVEDEDKEEKVPPKRQSASGPLSITDSPRRGSMNGSPSLVDASISAQQAQSNMANATIRRTELKVERRNRALTPPRPSKRTKHEHSQQRKSNNIIAKENAILIKDEDSDSDHKQY